MADEYLEAVDKLVAAARLVVNLIGERRTTLDPGTCAAIEAMEAALRPLQDAEQAVPIEREKP
jgi:hypothetical protein